MKVSLRLDTEVLQQLRNASSLISLSSVAFPMDCTRVVTSSATAVWHSDSSDLTPSINLALLANDLWLGVGVVSGSPVNLSASNLPLQLPIM